VQVTLEGAEGGTQGIELGHDGSMVVGLLGTKLVQQLRMHGRMRRHVASVQLIKIFAVGVGIHF
jgi:hypothetical protein